MIYDFGPLCPNQNTRTNRNEIVLSINVNDCNYYLLDTKRSKRNPFSIKSSTSSQTRSPSLSLTSVDTSTGGKFKAPYRTRVWNSFAKNLCRELGGQKCFASVNNFGP